MVAGGGACLVREGLTIQWEGSRISQDRLGNLVPQGPRGHTRQGHVPFAGSAVPRRAMTGLHVRKMPGGQKSRQGAIFIGPLDGGEA